MAHYASFVYTLLHKTMAWIVHSLGKPYCLSHNLYIDLSRNKKPSYPHINCMAFYATLLLNIVRLLNQASITQGENRRTNLLRNNEFFRSKQADQFSRSMGNFTTQVHFPTNTKSIPNLPQNCKQNYL